MTAVNSFNSLRAAAPKPNTAAPQAKTQAQAPAATAPAAVAQATVEAKKLNVMA